MTLPIVKNEEICAGDILLCFSNMMCNNDKKGGSGYSHVAISIDGAEILDANSKGVRITNISKLLDEYDHIAVMRNSQLWSPSRVLLLSQFASKCIGKEFNREGIKRYTQCKALYKETAMERVHSYFSCMKPVVQTEREKYFCSELVAAAFIHVGIIDQSAAMLFTPETLSPEDIGIDKAFGFFYGYLVSYSDYEIPDFDHFRTSI